MHFHPLSHIFHSHSISVSFGRWRHSNPLARSANSAFQGNKQSNTCVVSNAGSWSRWARSSSGLTYGREDRWGSSGVDAGWQAHADVWHQVTKK